jgi:hypothetical protein
VFQMSSALKGTLVLRAMSASRPHYRDPVRL